MVAKHDPEITVTQVRAARSWLRWTQDELALRSGVSKSTLVSYELDKSQGSERMLTSLKTTFEAAGITFLFEKGRAVGIMGPGPLTWLGTPVYESGEAAVTPPNHPPKDADTRSPSGFAQGA